ncbi:MAG: histidine phosphatase family protein [Gammaproteobacteria bacterium]|nr:histidine phosphatase family protein [Gammaproteobacteria bacterium]
MTIMLMRHGKPNLSLDVWIAPVQMAQWIEHYDRSEVEIGQIPNKSTELMKSATIVVSSTARRALSSARALDKVPAVVDALFSEAELPFALVRYPWLPPLVWAAIFRMLWFFGYSRGAESIRATRRRAKAAADKLIALSAQGSVLLVGHGIMNHLIAKELNAMGWRGGRPQSKYWSVSVYEKV